MGATPDYAVVKRRNYVTQQGCLVDRVLVYDSRTRNTAEHIVLSCDADPCRQQRASKQKPREDDDVNTPTRDET